jgi:DNA adenine methylase
VGDGARGVTCSLIADGRRESVYNPLTRTKIRSILCVMQPLLMPELAVLPPPLKWAGGKRWLVRELGPLWYPHRMRRLVEPFVGGMAVALGLLPDRALLSDANAHLINFYQWLQRGLVVDIEMRNDKDLYYEQREQFNSLVREGRADSSHSAQLFYYLNRTGYNGLCRFNTKGEFNVPFGRYAVINYVRDFTNYSEVLRGWEFTCRDFALLVKKPDDFIYADPPYDVPFTTYSPGGFNWDDQLRLAEWLASHDGPVIASNQATERILDLYQSYHFDIKVVNAPRMISCNGDRTPAKEMLATKGI